jgi:Fic family protein
MNIEKRVERLSKESWALIAKIDEKKGQWQGRLPLGPQSFGHLQKSVLITSTGASTRIEGAKLSDQEVEQLLKGLKPTTWESRDEQEVRGYYEVLGNVFEAWQALTLSESTIKHLHKEVLQYVSKDVRHRGDYKKTENTVKAYDETGKEIGIVFETLPAYLTPKHMQELAQNTQEALHTESTHPLIAIANFIVEFLYIHPFQDGNGRLSRILTNMLLLKAGYVYMPYVSHEKLIEDNKENYYLALRQSQKTFGTKNRENINDWLQFFLQVLLQQSEMALALIDGERIETLLSPKQLLVWEYMTCAGEVTPKATVEATGVARPTVNQALVKLVNLKKIQKIGQGRATRYRVV